MRTLIYDTETTGLVDMKRTKDVNRQPHLTQLAAMLVEDGQVRAELSLVIDAGVPIPRGASDVHGITNAVAERYGVKPLVAVGMFQNLLRQTDRVVAHNHDFDFVVMRSAYLRGDKDPSLFSKENMPRVDTMTSSVDLVNLPPTEKMIRAGFDKPKNPKLEELHAFLFGESFDGAHDAMVDVRACFRCLEELENREVELIGGKL